jgi:hypothetical protein
MRTTLPKIHPTDDLMDAQAKLRAVRLSTVPIIGEDGSLKGLLRVEDINEAYRFSLIGA